MNHTPKGPLVLIILDGWGLAPPGPGNAISNSQTPFFKKIWQDYPHTQLQASGPGVGLPPGFDGNSETGHLNIGAGYIVYQDLPRINKSIRQKEFFQNKAFLSACNHVKKNQSTLNLIGLLSNAGVHAHLSHLFALLKLAKTQKVSSVNLHLFTDGRDSSPTSSPQLLEKVAAAIKKIGLGQICTLIGRYYAMDRDNRWERTQKAYDLLILGKGDKFTSPKEAVAASYQAKKTDEFLNPSVITNQNGNPLGLIKDNDAIIFYNYRVDRPRQLTRAFTLADINEIKNRQPSFNPYAEKYFSPAPSARVSSKNDFQKEKLLQNIFFVTMTEYEQNLPVEVAFPPILVKKPLAQVISSHGLNQLHISETEKFPHVTYFFNGGRETKFPGEVRIKIPSPKVATYDLAPAMSASKVTAELLDKISTGSYSFIIVNLANPDMVAHTGNLDATIKACETTDKCLAKIVTGTLDLDGICLVIADHGNAEELINPETGEIDTEHSSNPVPFILVRKDLKGHRQSLPSGVLADIAPTILNLLNLPLPDSMTGQNLYKTKTKDQK